MSSFVLKNTSQLVRKQPVLSSTKNDCASGSYQVIIVWVLVCEETTVLSTTSVPRSLLTFLLWNSFLSSTLAFLTEMIFSWTVSKVPVEANPSSAIVTAASWLLSISSVKVKVLVPVSNLGKVALLGSGI